jgi:hypothetical protein
MAITAKMYGLAFKSAFNKEIAYATDVVEAVLCSSTYVPDQDTHQYASSLAGELTTTVGASLGTVAVAITTGVLTVSAAETLVVGDRVRLGAMTGGAPLVAGTTYFVASVPSSTTLTLAATLGGAAIVTTSAGSSTSIQLVTNYERVTMTGKAVTYTAATNTLMLDASDFTFLGVTGTFRYLVYLIDTGVAATSPLVAYVDFGADQTATAQNINLTLDPAGVVSVVVA